MQNGEIAMEELENMSFCIFYHIQKMPDDGHIRFFWGVMEVIVPEVRWIATGKLWN